MSYTSFLTPEFKRAFKRLAKKYASFENDFFAIAYELENNPFQGESLGQNLRKVRLQIASKNKGKSGGARLIILVLQVNQELVFITVYDKSELSSLEISALKKLAQAYLGR